MKKLWVVLLFLFASVLAGNTYAQVLDLGVKVDTDEFEGTTTCSQGVINPRTPDYLSVILLRYDSGLLTMGFVRADLGADDLAFNMFGASDGDEILFKLASGEVIRFDVQAAEAEIDDDFSWRASSVILVDEAFVRQLVSQPDDVRFRLSGAWGGEHDGTLTAEHLHAFSAFLQECL